MFCDDYARVSGPLSVLVNASENATVSAFDRGLTYGDGLFETVRFVRGHAPLWARHMQRLEEGCQRLRLPSPDVDELAADCAKVIGKATDILVRVTYTRGVSGRGYAPVLTTTPTRIIAAFPVSIISAAWYARGVRTRFCQMMLAEQPVLAGIKHLNRLEQVMARAEWDNEEIAEGFMCDTSGRVVCATAANIFIVLKGQVVTPALNRCGVAGVLRAEIISRFGKVQVRDLSVDELMAADEVFLTNSVRGVLPVTALHDKHWPVGPVALDLQAHWRSLGFVDPTIGRVMDA